MGGKGEGCDDAKDWSQKNVSAFIEILYDRVKQKEMQTSSFKVAVWKEINNELLATNGENYGVAKLRGKFNRLLAQHREFSTLLAHTGVTWDLEKNKVNAPPEVWPQFFARSKSYKQFQKKGGMQDYEILGEIFNNSTATGKMHYASTQEPPTSEEERDLEEDFLSNGVHVNTQNTEMDTGSSRESGKKNKPISPPSERRRKEPKTSKLSQLEACLEQWSTAMSARIEVSKARIEKYKKESTQVTSTLKDPYSIDECMDLLHSMEDIADSTYVKALAYFKEPEWRNMFVKMPIARRKAWH